MWSLTCPAAQGWKEASLSAGRGFASFCKGYYVCFKVQNYCQFLCLWAVFKSIFLDSLLSLSCVIWDPVNCLYLMEMALVFLHCTSKFVFKGAAGSPVWVTPSWLLPVMSGYQRGSTAHPGAPVLLLLCVQMAERTLPLKHCLLATLILLLWRWWSVQLWAYLCIAERIFRKFGRDVWLYNELILQTNLGLVQISSFKDPLHSNCKIHEVLLLLLKQHMY